MGETFVLSLKNTLDLTSGGFCIDSTSNSAKYQINFDTLFNNRHRLYKKCQVRCVLISGIKPNDFLPATIGSLNITGLSTQNSLGTSGLQVLSNLLPQTATFGTSSTGNYFFNRSTLTDANGVQLCSIPYGTQVIQVNFLSIVGVLLNASDIPDYSLELFFEMYDEY